MTFYFVRHGETEWNVKKKIQGKTDIPLNERGRKQAECLAKELKAKYEKEEFHVVRAYTSPQLRAADTAQTVANALGIECIALEELREMDLGEWEGSDWDTIKVTYGETYYYWNEHRRYTHTPGGENYDEVLARTLNALEEILARETEDVLVVSHSAVLMALRCYLENLPFEEMVKRFKTKNTEVVEITEEAVREAIERYRRGK